MSRKPVFDSILSGLNEALEDTKKETPALKRHRITVIPLKVYEANDIKKSEPQPVYLKNTLQVIWVFPLKL